ncbi:Cyclin-U4-1 [Diplonema papillatum]|nr:Cyclin-U4-1 [Diplonema papillatum]
MTVPSKRSFEEVKDLPSFAAELPAICRNVTEACRRGDGKMGYSSFENNESNPSGVFDGRRVTVSIEDYLVRLAKYGACSREVFVIAYVYLRRFFAATRFPLTSFNVHRVLLSAFVLAAKYQDDHFYSNKFYSQLGGVTLCELSRLEQHFLFHVQWELFVSEEQFAEAKKQLAKVPAWRSKARFDQQCGSAGAAY